MDRRTLLLAGLSAIPACLLPKTNAQNLSVEKVSILVVGSGAAGLSAALSSLESGAKSVLIIEKLPYVGGHSIFSSGSVASESTRDGIASMIYDMIMAGDGKNNPALVRTLCENSHAARMWLASYGLIWKLDPFQAVGSTAIRCYSTGSAQAGYDYIQLLNETARRYGAQIRFRTQATALIYDDDPIRVTGALVQNPDGTRSIIQSQAVILATGGFQASQTMRRRFCPKIQADMKTTANPNGTFLDGATGDGIEMAERLQAKLTDMQNVQILPFSGGRLLDYAGGEVWINALGKRFVNEGSVSFSKLYDVIVKQPDQIMWAISDSKSKKGATLGTKLHSGIVKRANTVEEMAYAMEIPSTVLKKTLDNYNRYAVNNFDGDFDCPMRAETIDTPPFYFGQETFSLHYCCGGLAIDTSARVLNIENNGITGLYACGEVTGGVHGADRLGGHGLIDCFVFGRIAGKNATRFSSI